MLSKKQICLIGQIIGLLLLIQLKLMNSKKLSCNKIHIIILIIGVLLIIQMFSGAVGSILNEIDNSDFSFTSKLIALDVCFYIICGVMLYQSLKYLKIQKTKMK